MNGACPRARSTAGPALHHPSAGSAPCKSTKPDPGKIAARIDETIEAIDAEDDPARRLELIQQRMDDEEQLELLREQDSIDDLQDDYVGVVADYSDRKGISYAAWRELGVPAALLRTGGLTRGR